MIGLGGDNSDDEEVSEGPKKVKLPWFFCCCKIWRLTPCGRKKSTVDRSMRLHEERRVSELEKKRKRRYKKLEKREEKLRHKVCAVARRGG